MANNKERHLLHARSLVTTPKEIDVQISGNGVTTSYTVNDPKKPLSERIEYGELAVNYAKGSEALFLKNSDGQVIQLNTIKNLRYDGEIDPILNKYLDGRYVNASGDTMYGDFTFEGENFNINASNELTLKFDDKLNITSEGDCGVNHGIMTIDPCVVNLQPRSELNMSSEDVEISANTVNITASNEIVNKADTIKEECNTYVNDATNATFNGNINLTKDLTVEGKATFNNISFGKIDIPNDSIGTEHIKNNAVTTEKIKDGAITESKLSDELKQSLGGKYVHLTCDTMDGTLNINLTNTTANALHIINGTTKLDTRTTIGKNDNMDDILEINGNVNINGVIKATNAIYSSDKTLKENIEQVATDEIQKVSQVDLVSYNFIGQDIKKYGIIAQDLEEKGLDNLVSSDDNGKKAVDYISFLVLKIAQLEAEIKELKNK